mmetsp:Transcript_32094/g.77981  ORF Transcript_32094/g.77981 Transcript_32094/m.77981 type:complete len:212 (-) Transcript_32094:254-889(-)
MARSQPSFAGTLCHPCDCRIGRHLCCPRPNLDPHDPFVVPSRRLVLDLSCNAKEGTKTANCRETMSMSIHFTWHYIACQFSAMDMKRRRRQQQQTTYLVLIRWWCSRIIWRAAVAPPTLTTRWWRRRDWTSSRISIVWILLLIRRCSSSRWIVMVSIDCCGRLMESMWHWRWRWLMESLRHWWCCSWRGWRIKACWSGDGLVVKSFCNHMP